MAIGGNPIVVDSSAANDTAPAQTQATTAFEFVVSDTFANLNNGDIGAGTFGPGSTYVGRLVCIRPHSSTEVTRRVTADTAGTGTTRILTVSEAFASGEEPAQNDEIQFCYRAEDVATATGYTFRTRNGIFEASRNLIVGDNTAQPAAGTFPWLAVLDSELFEINDAGTGTGLIIGQRSRFQSGFKIAGTPASGGTILFLSASDGENAFEMANTCSMQIYNTSMIAPVADLNSIVYTGDTVLVPTQYSEFENAFFAGLSNSLSLSGSGFDIKDVSFTGTDNTTSSVQTMDNFGGGSTGPFENVIFNSLSGLAFPFGGAATLRNCKFINCVGNINDTSASAVFVTAIDCRFSSNPPDLNLVSNGGDVFRALNTLSSVDRNLRLNLTVQDINQTGVDARYRIYEAAQTDGQLGGALITLGADGIANTSLTANTYTYTSGTSVNTQNFNNYAVKIYEYGDIPLDTGLLSPVGRNEGWDFSFTAIADPEITQATQATANTEGSGTVITRHGTGETDTQPMKLLAYDGGSGTLPSAGTTLTAGGGATGDVVEFFDTTFISDVTSGFVLVENWNGTEFGDNELLTGTGFTATTDTASVYLEYTWEYDPTAASNTDIRAIYDYQFAALDTGTSNTYTSAVMEFNGTEHAQMVFKENNVLSTKRNVTKTEGVYIRGLLATEVDFFTSDNGTVFNSPTVVEFTISNLHEDTEIRLFTDPALASLGGVESIGNTSSYDTAFTAVAGSHPDPTTGLYDIKYTYVYTSDIDIYVVAHSLEYLYQRLETTLVSTNSSIQINQIADRQYDAGSI